MTLSEEMRHRIYARLQELMGGEEAAALMAQLPPVAWADIATKHDIHHFMELVRGDIARLDARLDHTNEVLRADIARLEGTNEVLRGDIARLDARIDRLDATVADGRAEARAAQRTLFLGLVALQVSGAGLVLAVARLV